MTPLEKEKDMAGNTYIEKDEGSSGALLVCFAPFLVMTLLALPAWAGGRVAVLPLESEGLRDEARSSLMATISQVVADSYTLEAVTDDDFETMVDFELRDLAQFCDETDCRMDLARAARVDYLLRSKLASFGSGYSFELAIIGAMSGKVLVRQHGLVGREPMALLRGVEKVTQLALTKLGGATPRVSSRRSLNQQVLRRSSKPVPQQTKVLSGVLGGVGAAAVAWGVGMHAHGATDPAADGAARDRVAGGTLMGVGSAMILGALFYYGSELAQ
jgi:hypothetical protein